jgi:HEAT repeat protein
MRYLLVVLALNIACGEKGEPTRIDKRVADPRVAALVAHLADEDEQTRQRACLELGALGGAAARQALVGILQAPSPDPQRDGPMRLYAAAGLARMKDPASAIALIESLSRVNPNDNIAALAAEVRNEEYYTVDTQICEALLGMGLCSAEEELVNRMERKDRVRVLIDAHALLRRTTGFALPYHYNGSYQDRLDQAAAWRRKLRETRAERDSARPFDASDETFQAECRRVVGWLGGKAVNDRLIAHKVLELVGRYAQPFLEEALDSGRAVAQRQAAYMMGRIGHPGAAAALRRATDFADADARAEAMDGLRKVGDRESSPIAIARLADPDPEVRAAAARYLGAFGDAASLPLLRAAVAKEKRPAAAAALWIACLRRGDEEAAGKVLDCFVDGEQIEREAAQAAIEEWAGKPLPAGARDAIEKRRDAAESWRSR